METQVRYSSRKRVLHHLREGIANGTYPAGRRLPSERELADIVGVARPTVRRVLTMLDEEGVIHSNGGRLRLVSEGIQVESVQKIGVPKLLRNTLVLVSLGESGGNPEGREHGWSEWVEKGIFGEARKHQLHVLSFACSLLGSKDWEHILDAEPFGVIVTDLLQSWHEVLQRAETWRTESLPVVAHGNYPEMSTCDRVSSDHEFGGYLVTKALLEIGRKNVLMLGPPDRELYWFTERYAGYCRACLEHGVTPLPPSCVPQVPYVEDFKASFELTYRHLAGYLAPIINTSKVDALIAVSDGGVPHSIAACRALGKVPGKEILIAGYDDYWNEIPERTFEKEAPLFSVDKRNAVIGAEMVRLLKKRVSGDLPPETQTRLVKPILRRKIR